MTPREPLAFSVYEPRGESANENLPLPSVFALQAGYSMETSTAAAGLPSGHITAPGTVIVAGITSTCTVRTLVLPALLSPGPANASHTPPRLGEVASRSQTEPVKN